MEKDKLIEQILTEMGDKNNTIDLNAYGRGLIDMHDKLNPLIKELLEALKEMLLVDDLDEVRKHQAEIKAIRAINKAPNLG